MPGASMGIKRVTAHPIAYPEPNDYGNTRSLILTRVEADSGEVGWGEGITIWPEASVASAAIVERALAPLLGGRDPLDHEALWREMREYVWWYGGAGIASFALSAVDMALWDLRGKLLRQPLHALLGGKKRERLRACASSHPHKGEVEAMAREIADYAAEGYTAVKVGFGKKGNARLGEDLDRDVAFVAETRAALGPDVDFMVDVGYKVRWGVEAAIRRVAAFSAHGIRWIEDPLPKDDWHGYRALKLATGVAIATGEREWSPDAYRRLAVAGIADVVLADPGRVDGITGVWEVIGALGRAKIAFNAHSWAGALNTAASIHLTACAEDYVVMELKPRPSPPQHDIVVDPVEQKGGWIAVPETPGLGVQIREDAVRRLEIGTS
jgi:L-alanine-DL-glutamate epimerase-like enolase superfamily enzyme